MPGEVTKGKLQPPSVAFLEELRERARRYGWSGDYIEVGNFVCTLYGEAGLPIPDVDAYEICKKCDEVMPECTCENDRTEAL